MRTGRAAFLLPLLAAACATPPRIVFSKRAPDADTSPRRVFILSRLLERGSPTFGPVFAKAFEGRFDAALRRCGMQTAGYAASGLEVGEEIDRPMEGRWLDAVVIVRMSHGTVDQFGALVSGTIEITVFGGTVGGDGTKAVRQRPRMLWNGAAVFAHAGLGFTAMAAKAEEFADDLSNKMKEDGFFPGCPKVSPRDLPAVRSPVESQGYAAAPTLPAAGGLSVASISYLPAQLARVKAAEARKDPMGPNSSVNNQPPVYTPRLGPDRDQLDGEGRTRFAPGIDEYVRSALTAELRAMGIDTAGERRVLRGEIQDATLDASRWGYHVSLRVNWDLTEPGAGRVVYSAVKEVSTPPSSTPMLEVDALNQAIRASAEALVQDPEFARAIR